MSWYIYLDGEVSDEPYPKEELAEKEDFTEDTLVYLGEEDEWKKAGEVGELADIFVRDKPAPPSPTSQEQNDEQSSTAESTSVQNNASSGKEQSSSKLYCSNCGAYVSLGDNHCPECGTQSTNTGSKVDNPSAESEKAATPDDMSNKAEVMRCTSCNSKISLKNDFCDYCGAEISVDTDDSTSNGTGTNQEKTSLDKQEDLIECPNCGEDLSPKDEFCPKCGTSKNRIVTANEENPLDSNQNFYNVKRENTIEGSGFFGFIKKLIGGLVAGVPLLGIGGIWGGIIGFVIGFGVVMGAQSNNGFTAHLFNTKKENKELTENSVSIEDYKNPASITIKRESSGLKSQYSIDLLIDDTKVAEMDNKDEAIYKVLADNYSIKIEGSTWSYDHIEKIDLDLDPDQSVELKCGYEQPKLTGIINQWSRLFSEENPPIYLRRD